MDEIEHYVDSEGDEVWKLNGQYHRTDGPAVIFSTGAQCWFHLGEKHRDDGPAYIGYNGTQVWYQHGRRHRVGGPAAVYDDGETKWYIDGYVYSFDNYCKALNLTSGQIFELKVKYG